MDDLPDLPPLMLSGLTYQEAVQQMRATGCALRRPHWCAPILVAGKGRQVIFDNDGELFPFKPTPADRRAADWMMVEAPSVED